MTNLRSLIVASLAVGAIGGAYGQDQQPASTDQQPPANADQGKKKQSDDTVQGDKKPATQNQSNSSGGDHANVPVQRVEVTGSLIKRVDQETASPVTVISKEQIQEMGSLSLTEVLSHVSQTVNDMQAYNSLYTAAEGASDVDLRGLGPEATLTLLNGRRLSTYGATYNGQFQFVNIDSIPVDAIERIEILTDGASAMYGSDAIAGVINVITKTSYKGGEVHAALTDTPDTKNNREQNFGLSYGVGDLASDKYNIYGTLAFYQQKPVYANQFIGNMQPDYLKFNPLYVPNFHEFNGSPPSVTNPGTEFGYTPNSGTVNVPGPGCTTPYRASATSTQCAFDSFDSGNQFIPDQKHVNLFLNGHYEFSDSLEGFAEVSGYVGRLQAYTGYPNDYSGDVWSWYARNTGYNLQTFSPPYMSATNPYNVMANNPLTSAHMGGVTGITYNYLDIQNYAQHVDKDAEYRVVTGLRGTNGGWDWESAVEFAGTHSVQGSQGVNPSPQGFLAAFGPYTTVNTPSGSYQVMSDHPAYQFGTTNASNQALLQQMYPYFAYESWDEITNWDGKVSGKVGQLPGGDVMLAAGANLDHEMYSSPGSPAAAAGEIAWQGGSWTEGSRTTEAVYAELLAPITKKFEIDAALRDDKYPNFTNHITPKLGLKYLASDSLILRGTFSQGFRAPSLSESGSGGQYLVGSTIDPLRCAETNAIANVLLNSGNKKDVYDGQVLQSSTQCSGYNVGSIIEPNPDLKPETANIGSLGAVFNPSKMFDFSVDYWIVDRKNEIVQENASTVLQNALATNPNGVPGVFQRLPLSPGDIATNNEVAGVCASNPSLCGSGTPSYTVGNVGGVITNYVNLSQSLFDGFDLNANSHLSLGEFGKLDLGWQGSIKHRMDSLGPNANWQGNAVGTYGNPRVTGVLSAVWKYKDVDVSLMGNYTGPQSFQYVYTVYGGGNPAYYPASQCEQNLNTNAAICSDGVGSSTYWTGNVTWHPTKQFKVSLNVQNLFAREPRYDPEYGYFGVNAYEVPYMFGRVVQLNASYKF